MEEEKKMREEETAELAQGLVANIPVYAKELIAGGVAGGFAKTVVAPLERVKILFQLNTLSND